MNLEIIRLTCICPDIYQTGMPGSTTVPPGKSAGLPQPPGAFSAPPASQKPPPPVANNLPQPPGQGKRDVGAVKIKNKNLSLIFIFR